MREDQEGKFAICIHASLGLLRRPFVLMNTIFFCLGSGWWHRVEAPDVLHDCKGTRGMLVYGYVSRLMNWMHLQSTKRILCAFAWGHLVKGQSRGDKRYRGCSDVAPMESSAAMCIVNLRSRLLYEA
jgi:hypothetical protein